jgi:hypothetical protein
MEDMLFSLMLHIWRTKTFPAAFDIAELIPLWKKKGSPDDPATYRGVSILAVVGKVFARILAHRLTPHLESQMHDMQCGFRPDRGVVDQIFVLQQVVRQCRRQGLPAYAAFVDIEKAYDCVDRQMLFRLLAAYGVDRHLVDLLRALYKDTKVVVKVGNVTGREFSITTGVRQGCLPSSTW